MRRLVLLVAIVVVVGASVMFTAQPANAARCGGSIVTPITHLGKPAISVYTASNVKPQNVVLTFDGRGVPNSDWGIRTDAPQSSSGGRWVYFIATRWLLLNPFAKWSEGWRWKFVYDC